MIVYTKTMKVVPRVPTDIVGDRLIIDWVEHIILELSESDYQCAIFPPTLSSVIRKRAHGVAGTYNMHSKSIGPKKIIGARSLVITRKPYDDLLFDRLGDLDWFQYSLMFHCVVDGIYVGSVLDARDTDTLSKHEVTTIVNCASEYEVVDRENGTIIHKECFLPPKVNDEDYDGLETKIVQMADEIITTIGDGGSVLVHCLDGYSRCPLLILFYMFRSGLSMRKSYRKFIKTSTLRVHSSIMKFLMYLEEKYSGTITLTNEDWSNAYEKRKVEKITFLGIAEVEDLLYSWLGLSRYLEAQDSLGVDESYENFNAIIYQNLSNDDNVVSKLSEKGLKIDQIANLIEKHTREWYEDNIQQNDEEFFFDF